MERTADALPPLSREYVPSHWTVPLSLPQSLRPWSFVTSQWSVAYRFATASPPRGVVAVITIDLKKAFPEWRMDDMTEESKKIVEARMVALREATELCALHWQLHPPALRSALQYKSAALVEEVDAQGVCLDVVDLEFELDVPCADTQVLGDVIAPMLSNNPRGQLYRSVRGKLQAPFERSKAVARPIHITIDAKMREIPSKTDNWHAERFFSQLTGFAACSTSLRATKKDQTFVLTRIHVSLDSIPITSWMVHRILELARIGRDLVVFDKLTIDPTMTACGNEDIRRLVKTVTDVSPGVILSTGDLPPNADEQKEYSHVSSECLMSLAQAVRGAIARSKTVNAIDLSHLVFLVRRSKCNKMIWKALAGCLSSGLRSRLIENLVINAPVMLNDEDAKIIRRERQRGGKKRRVVKSISIDVAEISESAALELVSLAAGVESLSLSRRQGSFSASILLGIMKRAPHLHTLELDRVKIECNIDMLPRAVRWRSLSLVDIEIDDIAVLTTFLHKLGDPTCALAKSLQELRLSSRTNAMAVSDEAVLAIEKALGTNQVLQKLHLTVQNNVSPAAIAAVRMHEGDLVLQPQPRQRAAFLSVVNHISDGHPFHRVDNFVIQNIFSFSTIRLRRHVSVKLAPSN